MSYNQGKNVGNATYIYIMCNCVKFLIGRMEAMFTMEVERNDVFGKSLPYIVWHGYGHWIDVELANVLALGAFIH